MRTRARARVKGQFGHGINTEYFMVIIHNPQIPLHPQAKLALAIGVFDGMHRGHCALLERLKQVAQENHYASAVITYTNHPAEILRSDQQTPMICSTEHKLTLLEQSKIDYIFLYTFDEVFASQTAEHFLSKLMQVAPFVYLNMGHDGRIGKNRSGDQEHLIELSQKLHFTLEYMPPFHYQDTIISSRTIRQLITEGNLNKVSMLLGRPYSIVGKVTTGIGAGKELGFPTANIPVKGLVTPPAGVWAVEALWDNHRRHAIANLGFAPTVHKNRELFLEVHIPNYQNDLYGKTLEIIFHHYIRPEQRFENITALKQQLHQDVQAMKQYFKIQTAV